VHCYRRGVAWWPDKEFEREHIQPEQEKRYEADAWEETISDYLVSVRETTVSKIAINALGFKTERLGTVDQRRITAILTTLGWEQKRANTRRWWAKKPGKAMRPR
jgi:predicted P-loop ATPase